MTTRGRKAHGAIRPLGSGRYQARITIRGITYTQTFESREEADSWLGRRREYTQNPAGNLEELIAEEARALRSHLDEEVESLSRDPSESDRKRISLIRRFLL